MNSFWSLFFASSLNELVIHFSFGKFGTEFDLCFRTTFKHGRMNTCWRVCFHGVVLGIWKTCNKAVNWNSSLNFTANVITYWANEGRREGGAAPC